MTLAWLLSLALAAGAAEPAKPNTQTMQEAYDQAFQLYQAGDYRKAISKWNDILRSDPGQNSARKMIDQARREIAEQVKRREAKVRALVGQGKYRAGLLEVQALIDLDPSDARFRSLQKRLDDVAQIVPEAPAAGGRAWRAAAAGLGGFLGTPQNLRLAYNGLRYAAELAPNEESFPKLVDVLKEHYPNLQEDEVTPGMTLIEYKHLVALHHIYDARYHAAIAELDEILQLEPDDLVALKQLGSAYFSLGRKPQARDAWSRALRLSPHDPTLKEFLAKLK